MLDLFDMFRLFRFVFFFWCCMVLFTTRLCGQITIDWEKNYGGSSHDFLNAVQATQDGGYLLVGHSGSSDFDCDTSYGSNDFFIIKTDSIGQIQWSKHFGGTDWDAAYDVIEISSSNFIIAGRTLSSNTDVTFSHGSWDIWIIQIDATGNLIWEKTYGGSSFEGVWDMEEASPNAFLLAGYSASNNGDLGSGFGQTDAVVMKIDSLGNLSWLHQFGGNGDDWFYDLQTISDGGIVVTGSTNSVNGQVANNYGNADAWVVWLDSLGNLISNKTYGGSLYDNFQNALVLANGDLLLTGTTESYDYDVTNNYGQKDYWLVRTDSSGLILWQKNYGGSGNDIANKTIAPNASEFILCGYSSSTDNDVTGNYGLTDFWVVQMDFFGQLVQENHFGSSLDEGGSIYLVDSANFVLYGSSEGYDYDIATNYGGRDYWFAAMQYQSVTGITSISTPSRRVGFPVPATDQFSFSLLEGEVVNAIALYDLAGKLIGKPMGTSNKNTYTIDIGELPNGIYITTVQTSRGSFMMQTIVMR